MTTPIGTISMSDINLELNKGSTDLISLNDGDVRTLAGIATGTISMDNLRGKTAINYGTLTTPLTTRAEGQSFTFTLSGGTVPDGTYYWKVESISNMALDDYTVSSGSFTVSANTGNFTVGIVNDTIDEGDGTFRVIVGETSGVPVARVTGPTCTVTESTTYTASTNKTSIYRYGDLLSDRSVTYTLNTTQVSPGTTLYYKVVSVTGSVTFNASTNSGDILASSTGSRIVSGTAAAGSIVLAVAAADYIDGTTATSKTFRVDFYTDVGLTNLVATGPVTTLRAAPTYSISVNPTSINEGATSTVTVTAANFPLNAYLYFTTTGSTASPTSDWLLGSSSGSILMSSSSTQFYVTAAYDSTSESNETLKFNLCTVSTSGSVVGTTTITFVQNLGVVGTATIVKSGGATLGSAVTVTLQLSGLSTYPASRSFSIEYNLNGTGYLSNSPPLLTTSISVAAGNTSSSVVTILSRTTDTVLSSLIIRVSAAGHTSKTSNTLTGGYI